jgi:hypothetical protein
MVEHIGFPFCPDQPGLEWPWVALWLDSSRPGRESDIRIVLPVRFVLVAPRALTTVAALGRWQAAESVIRNSTQRSQEEGRKSRAAVLDYLAEALTSPANPATAEQIREFKMTSWYFSDLRQAIDKVDRSFADTPDLRKAIMLAAAYEIIERLIAWNWELFPIFCPRGKNLNPQPAAVIAMRLMR